MYDVVIIGGGPAGMSAAIYAARGGMKTLVIEKLSCGGQAVKTYEIDNYPGFDDCPSGQELSDRLEKHARRFGAEFVREAVKSIENAPYDVKIIYTRRNKYMAKSVIIATGASPKTLGAEGEEQFRGAGVSYCATCDGAFFKDKDVAVIGGGNTAFEDALYLAGLCSRVYLLNRSKKFRANASLVKRATENGKIKIITDTVAERFVGGATLSEIKIQNTVTKERGSIKAAGAIIAVGIKPDSGVAKLCGVETCERGFIKTDMNLATNIRGIFAAGDVRVTPLRQVITAAADGAVAAVSATAYVNELGFKSVL
ncbi:MAG: FAD-dependent oxidoreductase [Clostridiales bacterium]|nr:FAD-dependent oxidoreductase [Clostridiales bacterium]